LRQTGAEVSVDRFGLNTAEWDATIAGTGAGAGASGGSAGNKKGSLKAAPKRVDLVVLSPGPGRPSDFALSDSITACLARKVPLFGVCLGLQGMVEHFGGELGVLDYPM
jgi:hypothetical protein